MSRQADITPDRRALATLNALDVATASRSWLANDVSLFLWCCLIDWISSGASPSSLMRKARGEMNAVIGAIRMKTMAAMGTNRFMRAPALANSRSGTRIGFPTTRGAGAGDADI